MKRNEDSFQPDQLLTNQVAALVKANEQLKAELAEQKRTINALLANEQGQAPALLTPQWYWEQNTAYRFTIVSTAMESANLQPDTRDILGKCSWELPGAMAQSMSWDAHRTVLEAHQPFRDFEFLYLIDDILPRYLSVSGEAVYDSRNNFTGYRGTMRDISARKHFDIALQASESRFRTVVAALGEAVIIRDADGKIVDCNLSAERFYGRTLAEIKGQISAAPDWQMLREDGTPMPVDEWPSVVARRTGLPQTGFVLRYHKSNGSEVWGQINVQPLFDGQSESPSGFVSTITDISKSKLSELEVVRLNVELESRVSRRTAELKLANKELEAFSYSVAHDLRSPLNAIGGYCSLLKKQVQPVAGDTGERGIHYLTRIGANVEHMGELINGLLSLAHLSRANLRWEPVDLSAEANKILQQYAENDSARQVVATVEPGLLVEADRSLLRQVLENLIANAWKFTSKKSSAQISVGRKPGADLPTVYFVQDNGAGFDMAYADNLFGTFQRLHSAREFAGTGIGLATVKRIIDRHGGKIWADSVEGVGSSFFFTLGRQQSDTGLEGPSPTRDTPARETETVTQTIAVTQRKNQEAFSVSDQQINNLFEHAAIGMTVVGFDGVWLTINSAFSKMLGYSEAEVLARSVQQITHPDDLAEDIRLASDALTGKIETYHREKRLIHKSGRIVWVFLTCSLVRDSNRKPLHFITQIQNISDLKQKEQILRLSEERFRSLTALSSDWFWEQDENYRFSMVSSDAAQGARIGPDSAIGKSLRELDSGSHGEEVWSAHLTKLQRREEFREFEITRRGRHGELIYECVSGVPVFDDSGRFTGYRGICRDTTEMRLVANALRSSESQLRQITNNVTALLAYVDVDQRFRFHNRAFEEVFGLEFDAIDGQTLASVLGQQFHEDTRDKVREVLGGYPVEFESLHMTSRGKQKKYAMQYLPRYGNDADENEVIGFYVSGVDITKLERRDAGATGLAGLAV